MRGDIMLGKRIKARREELGLSQAQLAEKVGVGKTSISNYEKDVSSPNEPILIKLFDALKCDANYLYADYIVTDDGFILTEHEKELIETYRSLDEIGKQAVCSILYIEQKRNGGAKCQSGKE